MGEAVIRVRDLVRVYRTTKGYLFRKPHEVRALDGVSFEVQRGEMYGILGPNGAGKTTAIKVLTTLLWPTSGTARVLGLDTVRDAPALRERINLVLGGERGLYWRLTGRDNLLYFATLYGLGRAEARERSAELLATVGLADRADEKVEKYSRGMRQRLHLAKGLVNDPEVLFMDEPTIGLDPEAARLIRSHVRDLARRGRTVVLTTHNMAEADELCHRIAVLARGRVAAEDQPAGLKRLVRERNVVEVRGTGFTAAHVEALRRLDGAEAVAMDDHDTIQVLRVQAREGHVLVPRVTSALVGARVLDVRVREATLEDAYLRLVGA